MATTLADLTLKLSRDLGRLEQRSDTERLRAGAKKDEALSGIPEAAKATRAFVAAVERSRRRKLEAVARAPNIRDEAIANASQTRSEAHLDAEGAHRRQQESGRRKWSRAKRDAKSRYEAARKAATKLPVWPSSSRGKSRSQALAEAEEDYRSDLEKAQTRYEDAVEDARAVFRSALDAALEVERRSVRAANRSFTEAIDRASREQERDVQAAQAELRLALRDVSEAASVIEAHELRLAEIQNDYTRRKEALFAKFERDKRDLTAGG